MFTKYTQMCGLSLKVSSYFLSTSFVKCVLEGREYPGIKAWTIRVKSLSLIMVLVTIMLKMLSVKTAANIIQ